MPTSLMDYLARLLRAEAGRVRDEVPADVKASGAAHHSDRLAASLERMASRIEATMTMGGVDDAEAA